MNRLFIFITFCAVTFITAMPQRGHAQDCEWIKTITGSGPSTGSAFSQESVADNEGNLYIAGIYQFSVFAVGTTTLTCDNPFGDIFVAKYDAAGNVLWGKKIGGSTAVNGLGGMTKDNAGNIYVSGYLTDDSAAFGGTSTSGSDTECIFVEKFNSSGAVVWVKTMTNQYGSGKVCIATDASGNILLSDGYFGSIKLDTFTLTDTAYTFFVAKLDTGGRVLWAKTAAGTNEFAAGIATDGNGNAYICTGNNGTTTNAVHYDTLTFTGGTFSLLKIDSDGNGLWMKGCNENNYYEGSGLVTTDIAGNVYMAGFNFGNSIAFDTYTLSITDTNFLVKYDPNGNVQWLKGNTAGPGYSASTMTGDSYGNIFIAGSFFGGPISFGSFTLPNRGAFIVAYNGAGDAIWAKGNEEANSSTGIGTVATNANGQLYASGDYLGALQLDGLSASPIPPMGFADIYVFVAKYYLPSLVVPSITQAAYTIYPNPTGDMIYISGTKAIADICIYNAGGQIVYKTQGNGVNAAVSMRAYAPGTYFVSVNNEMIKKVVKE